MTVTLDKEGCLTDLRCSGHSLSSINGSNIACISVSTLVRSVSRLLSLRKELVIKGSAQSEGSVCLKVEKRPEPMKEWLLGVTEFFIQGISDINSEYPSEIKAMIQKET